MIVATKAAVTVDELEKMPDGDRFELDHGMLVERSMSPESAEIAGEIYARLREFVLANPIGKAFPDGCGFTIRPDDDELLRKPDASFVLKSKLPAGKTPKTRFRFSPDLAVEVQSPSDNADDVERKIQEYLDAGTQIVWLVRPNSRRIIVYTPDGSENSYGPKDELTAEPILPGFRMKVADVFTV